MRELGDPHKFKHKIMPPVYCERTRVLSSTLLYIRKNYENSIIFLKRNFFVSFTVSEILDWYRGKKLKKMHCTQE